jgi:2-amino-4-hydroxy-6-hydroxymethyldihydropteridine diphosphokinase
VSNDLRGTISFIGIGANLGQPEAQCREAVARLKGLPGVKVLRMSSFYRSEPVGFMEQDWFVNGVAEVRTTLTPFELLEALRSIEQAMGRQSTSVRWGPRWIDLDILLYGQEVLREEALTIPHRDMHKRRFVLAPLHELAPYAIHPAFGVSIQGLLHRLEDDSRVELMD